MSEATFLSCESSGEPEGFARKLLGWGDGCYSRTFESLYISSEDVLIEPHRSLESMLARLRAQERYWWKCRIKAARILQGLPSEDDWESVLEDWGDSDPYADFLNAEERLAKQAEEKQELEKLLAERPKEAEKQPDIPIEENRQFYIELIERSSSQPCTLSSEHEDNLETKLRLSLWDSHVIDTGVLELCLASHKVPVDEEGALQALVAC